MTETQPTLESVIAKFSDYPLAQVPIEIFLNNTDRATYKTVSSPNGDMIIASTNWQDLLKKAERVAILCEDRGINGKGVALNFYGERINNNDEFPSLLERFCDQCQKRRFPPLDNPELSITALPEDTNVWSAALGHSYSYQIRLKFQYSIILLGEHPTAARWLLERALEAAQLAGVAVAKRKMLKNNLTEEWSGDIPEENDDFWKKQLESNS